MSSSRDGRIATNSEDDAHGRYRSCSAVLTSADRRLANKRSFGKRHISDETFVEDVSLEIFYKPHSIILLVSVISIIVYIAIDFDENESSQRRILKGLGGVALAFVTLGVFALPCGPFIRPHPTIWRFVLSMNILYWLALICILFQDYTDLRIFIGQVFPELKPDRTSGPLPWTKIDSLDAATYAQDCTFSYENVMLRVDIFVTAHLLGWMTKALILRSYSICIIGSLWWEISELFFAGLLPNFLECWWDQFLMDVAIFNMLGIILGIQVCKYLEVREYNWTNFRALPSTKQKIKRAMAQFTPENWMLVRWTPLVTWKRYTQVVVLICIITIAELNAFFLKSTFEIRTSHVLNISRCVLWGVIGCPALRQSYVFMTDPSCIRIGTQAWVAMATVATECLIWIKFGVLRPDSPWDLRELLRIISMWIPSLFVFTYVCLYLSSTIENMTFCKKLWATKYD